MTGASIGKPESGTPLRSTLLAIWVAALVYVAVIGGLIVFRISPAATTLQQQSRGILDEFQGSQQRAELLESVTTALQVLASPAADPVGLDSLESFRLRLQATADSSHALERLASALGGTREMRRILVNAVNDEMRLRVAILAAIAALELDDRANGARALEHADSLVQPLRRALNTATSLALLDVNAHESALAGTARTAVRLVWVWLLGGLVAIPLLAAFFRRRLYAPLAALDRGLARVAAGDLEAQVAAQRTDELGRLAEHFNRMTGVLRLRASEEEQRTADEMVARTRLILNAALDAVIVMDAGGNIREWNPQAELVFGWPRAEVLGRPLAATIVPPESRDPHTAGLAHFAATGHGPILNRRFETEALRRDGSRFPVEIAIVPIRRGKELEFSGFVRDITERKASRAALMASEERYRAAFEQASVGMAEVSPEGRYLRVNRAFEEITGRSAEELRGMSFEAITHPDDLGEDREVLRGIFSGGTQAVRREKRYVRKDGSIAWVDLASAPVRDSAGEPAYALTVVQDVTAQKRLESDLIQAQKLDAVGRLAGGIAHDFNNLLTGIIGYADLLSLEEGASPRVRHDAGAIIATAQRGAALARNLLTLARRSPDRSERVDLHDVAREVVELIRRTFDRRIAIRLDLAPSPPILAGDRSQLTNALLNLALNARDAMTDGGTLTIATRRVTLDAGFCARHAEPVSPGAFAALTVGDTGMGMSPDTRSRIFEPFFTTKPVGKGTGLGLALVYGTVRSHGGLIEVDSAAGAGSTFTLFLPEQNDAVAGAPADPGGPLRGAGRILLVDDEETVRHVVGRMLAHLGYRVSTAADGEEAVERVRAEPGAFDLVILDGNMPRLPGRAAARRIRALDPAVPLLLATGYLDPGAADGVREDGFNGAIAKPYNLNELSRVVAQYRRASPPEAG
ncbi:MAG TPA: PAS domain S-box protein [Gemmatimonadales bacterium]|nr:PAS domain S-box protein [Gemmatimonadales bacterium]